MERLQQIKQRCYTLIASHPTDDAAIAGWQCTIIAIEHLIRHGFHGGTLEKNILEAWKEVEL